MITLAILFVAIYAWRLFAWQDILPLTMGNIMYMIPFTLTHMLSSIGVEYFEDTSLLIGQWSFCLTSFCN